MSPPLVTVIIPVYNAGAFLRPAVDSVLAQTHGQLEIIVVDDGSTDHCVDTIGNLRDERLVIVHRENGGKSAAMNQALARMKGDFWCIQDADDLSYPERIECLLAALVRDPGLAAVYSGTDLLMDGVVFAPTGRAKNRTQCRAELESFRLPAHDATGLYRTKLVADLGFDPALRIGQGVDFMLRVGERHPVEVLGRCLYSHRVNRTSTTHRSAARNIDHMNRVIEKACARRGIDFGPFRRPAPSPRTFFRHRSVDTIVPYASESVKQLKLAGKRREAWRTAMISARLHPLDPLYYKPLLHWMTPTAIGQWWSATRERRALRRLPAKLGGLTRA
jgi:glycosyltransferase involved in cell wall biosynthesis